MAVVSKPFRPVRDYLIIRTPKPQKETTTAGGIVVMEMTPEQEPVGEILACGPKVQDSNLTVGTRVLFEPFNAFEVPGDDDAFEVLAIREEFLIAVQE